MTGVAITILVKNPNKSTNDNTIKYYEIDDFLTKKDKLLKINELKSIAGISNFIHIKPNINNDWINQRSNNFEKFININPLKNFDTKSKSFFLVNGVGISSAREAWVYNYSPKQLGNKLESLISFYNSLIDNKSLNENNLPSDNHKISWSVNLKKSFKNRIKLSFNKSKVSYSMLRPFSKNYLYYDKNLIERPGIGSIIFPNSNIKNLAIILAGTGNRKDFVSLIVNVLPDYNNFDGGTKYFPLYYYEENTSAQKGLFDDNNESDYVRRDAISDFILERAKQQYGKNVTKEDIFYYVYGFLHSKEYRETFEADLKKMLPKLPLVEDVRHFWAFSKAGRELAELHLNYETVAPHPDVIVNGEALNNFKVEKMKFIKKGVKDTILYNNHITVSNIPDEAYNYIVNGKSAIEWIMERYAVTTHKDSGITNNPNDWSEEVGNPRYILDLLLSIINVSIQTVDIVNKLPKINF